MQSQKSLESSKQVKESKKPMLIRQLLLNKKLSEREMNFGVFTILYLHITNRYCNRNKNRRKK